MELNIGGIIAIVLVLLVGVIMLGFINDTVGNATTTTAVTGETEETTVGVLFRLDNYPVQSGTETIYNTTGSKTYTRVIDYNITYENGLVNMSYGVNLTINYSYQQSGYIDSSTTQTILNNIPILMGVFLLFIAGMYFYSKRG